MTLNDSSLLSRRHANSQRSAMPPSGSIGSEPTTQRPYFKVQIVEPGSFLDSQGGDNNGQSSAHEDLHDKCDADLISTDDTTPLTSTTTEQLKKEIRYWKDCSEESRNMFTHHIRRADMLSTELNECRDKILDQCREIRGLERNVADLERDKYALQTTLRLTDDRNTRAEEMISDLRTNLKAEKMAGTHCAEMAKDTYGHLLGKSTASIRSAYQGSTSATA